jgi:hypothetical protein
MIIEVLDSVSIDYEEMNSLLTVAFAGRSQSKVDVEIPSPESLEFKYRNAVASAKLATARCDGKLVAMNGLIPIEIWESGKPTLAWMSCDTATHPDYQGQGLFKKCVSALEDSLPSETFLFGFPNQNSMPGFIKMGWRCLAEVDLYFSSRILGRKRLATIIGVDIDSIVVNSPNHNGIVKSREYLLWRYGPDRGDYQVHEIKSKNFSCVTVTRKIQINGFFFSLVLEVFSEDKALSGSYLRKLCKEQKTFGLLIAPLVFSRLELRKNGFIKVPGFLVSRKVVLAGKFVRSRADKLSEFDPWNLSLGDFDAL